ncbi:uncharacterized protein [Pleurodeles waltl]|uniref:uncharacterized protein n=1 Tax=Pleurodeles waltl TaxID=8319 RepID=UPI003709AA29
MEPGNSSMEQSVSSELEDMRHELCDFIRSSVHQAVSSSLQKLSKNLENNLSNLISKSAQTAGECSTRPPAKPDMGTHMESESFSRMPEDAVPHKAPAKEYNNMAPKSSLKRKSKERNVLPVISPVIQDTDEDMPDVDSDSYLSDKDDDESFSIPPKKPKITSATPSLFDSEGFPMFDPSQIHHPNSTEWFPADHVGRYVAQKLFSPLDKQTRSKLKSECPRPVLSNKATITPTIDEQMLTFFTKQGKDPRKGVDKAWSSCQDKLLDITGPLTRIFDLVESARLDGSFLDPEELSLWIQRCFCLLGNANSSFIHERRKGLLIKLDPKLVKLATVQPQFQSDGQLFGDSFIKDLGKYVATFTSLTKAQQSMRKMFHQRVFARAGRGRGRFTGRGFTNQGSRGYYSSYQQDFRPQFYPQRGRGYRARSTRHSRATNPTVPASTTQTTS